ncbi:THAP domain-containing protein 3-like [Engraulis encrasicolus]|uniref:THAP domain-containing protein 3-like n=1 Tax=Engraulis encrasicolus TaxID=184585 RepID=UPI002FD144A5
MVARICSLKTRRGVHFRTSRTLGYTPSCNGASLLCAQISKRKKNPTVDTGQTFHRFLKGQALRREWINHIQRESGPYFKINAETNVCSEHFEKQCFVKTACGITKLIKHAVPTLFVWTSERPKMRIIIRRPSMDSMEVDENQPDERRDALSRGTSSTPVP